MSWLRKRKETEHRNIQEQLSAYLDGELLPREREAVEQHLITCSSCRWNLKTLRQTVQWTSELPTVRVPRTFTVPVPARPVPAPRRWRFVPVLQGATALVALLLFFVIAGDAMLTGFQPVTMRRPETQALPVEATSLAEARGAEVTATVLVETVVVEKEAEGLMLQEAPAAEEPAAEEAARMLEVAPAETATVIVGEEIRATMAPAGGGEGAEDARAEESVGEETVAVEAAAPAPLPSEPSLAEEAAAVLPTATTKAMIAPTLAPTATTEAMTAPTPAPAPTEVAMPPPSAQVEVGEALSVPGREPASEWRHGLKPAVLMGVRWVEYALGVLLIVLVGTTIGAMVWRRSKR